MPSAASLVIEILAKTQGAVDGLDKTADSAGRMQRGVNKAAGVAAAGLVAVAGAAMECVSAASAQEQAFGGLDAVFKESSGQMKAWAKTAANSVGMSATAYAEAATSIGGQLKSVGIPMDEVTGKTNDMIKTAAALAGTYGGTTAEAVQALGSAFRGEADPAEKYNLNLKQSAVAAQMAADGTDKLTGKAAEQAKTQAILKMITAGSADAVKQFGDETNTAAFAAQQAEANFVDAKSALGTQLLPAITAVTKKLSEFATWVSENQALVSVLVGVFGILAVAILAVAAAMWVMNAAAMFSPITWAVIGIAVAAVALAAALAWVITNFDKVVNAFKAGAAWIVAQFQTIAAKVMDVARAIKAALSPVWNWLRAQAAAVGNWIKAQFARIAAPIVAVANRIKAAYAAAWNALKSAARAVASSIRSAFAAVAGPVMAVANRIKSAFVSAFNSLKSAAGGLGRALSAPFNAIKGAINSVIGAVQSLIGWISRIKIPSINIPGVGGRSATAGATVRSTGSPTLTARTGRATSTTGGGVVINVNGALDPEGVARQIRTILGSASVRRQGVVLAART